MAAASFALITHVGDYRAQIALVSLAVLSVKGTFAMGFMVAYSEMAGPYAGFAYGISNSIAQSSGFIIPYVVAYFVSTGVRIDFSMT